MYFNSDKYASLNVLTVNTVCSNLIWKIKGKRRYIFIYKLNIFSKKFLHVSKFEQSHDFSKIIVHSNTDESVVSNCLILEESKQIKKYIYLILIFGRIDLFMSFDTVFWDEN